MKRARGGTGTLAPTRKKMCAKHKVPMQFKPEEGRWVCPIDDCKVISYPEIDGDRTRLLLGRGGLQLVCVNGQFYLRAIDNNVALVLPITAVGGSGTDDFVEVRFRVPLVSLDVP